MSGILDFLKAAAGICETSGLNPDRWQFDGNRATVKLNEVEQLKTPGGAVYLKGKGLKTPVLIVRTEQGDYRCLSNRCTHMGRRLDPVPGKPIVRCCSVNHSCFDYSGQKLSGPGNKPLKTYRSEVKNGDLVIFL
ncbi:MAG: Rieske (2Fe-2S) protein [Deltaproteobacteria bacterium]